MREASELLIGASHATASESFVVTTAGGQGEEKVRDKRVLSTERRHVLRCDEEQDGDTVRMQSRDASRDTTCIGATQCFWFAAGTTRRMETESHSLGESRRWPGFQ